MRAGVALRRNMEKKSREELERLFCEKFGRFCVGNSATEANAYATKDIASGFIFPMALSSSKETGKYNVERLRDQIKGLLFGAALGDAYGVATEFMSEDEVRRHYGKDPRIKFGVNNTSHDGRGEPREFAEDSHRRQFRKGDWTDDTDQQIAILDSLIAQRGHIDELDYAKRLQDWVLHGIPDFGDTCGIDCGVQTGKVVLDANYLSDPIGTALNHWVKGGCYSAPNGALMRTSLLGTIQFWNADLVASNTCKFARISHSDPKCLVSSVVDTLFVSKALTGSNPFGFEGATEGEKREKEEKKRMSFIRDLCEEACAKVDSHIEQKRFRLRENPEWKKELLTYALAPNLDSLEIAGPHGIGYTYRCLGAALFGVRIFRQKLDDAEESPQGKETPLVNKTGVAFKEAIHQIVVKGGDADTNGAVCGALIGVLCGYSGLPKNWIDGLIYKTWLDIRIERLLDMMFANSPRSV